MRRATRTFVALITTSCCLLIVKFMIDNTRGATKDAQFDLRFDTKQNNNSASENRFSDIKAIDENTKSKIQIPNFEVVNKHRTPLQTQEKTVEQEKQLCLKLAPKEYIAYESRTFTAQELNITQYKNKKPRIPKIIHQTWDTYDIPIPAVKFVKSVVKNHPDWEYWFWTAEDRNCFVKTYYPELLTLFHDYTGSIFRTNVGRYLLLYEYGGFYLDLDVESLKPLDIWAHMGDSILSHETYEHTFFAHLRLQPNVMNTVMATRPKHPYYKFLQKHLQMYHEVCPQLNLYSTGPFYIDNMYQLYVQANQLEQEENKLTIIHPRYWLPTFAASTEARVRKMCHAHVSLDTLTSQQKELCEIARSRDFQNKPWEDSFLNHYWANSNVRGSSFRTKETQSIFDLVPNLKKVSDILNLNCTT